jgi:hypothetical protein
MMCNRMLQYYIINNYSVYINRVRGTGHAIRRENEGIIKRLMIAQPEGKRKKARPRMRWTDGVEKNLRNLDVVNWSAKHKRRMAGENF